MGFCYCSSDVESFLSVSYRYLKNEHLEGEAYSNTSGICSPGVDEDPLINVDGDDLPYRVSKND